jgi:hypothetical protein
VKIIHALSIACLLLLLTACPDRKPANQAPEPCTERWYQELETTVSSGDGMGHGPDIGSEEWKSVIEFKLGVRGNQDVPDRNSLEWCRFIDDLL